MLVSVLFVLSGALALVYEVLWMRGATVVFGASAPATAATLSGMFLGMAVGAAVLGRIARQLSHPLRIWGLLEIGIGSGALLVTPIFALYARIFPLLHHRFADAPVAFTVAKTLLALAAFLPATFCMGGTLPVLARLGGGRMAAGLYALNTLGAAAGALLVPHALLPGLGARGALLAAALASGAIGVVAIAGSRAGVAGARQPDDPLRPGRRDLALALLSGFLVLAIETLAVRMLALIHDSSVQAFALVVAIFLLGLALGAGLGRGLLGRDSPRSALALCWCGAGLLTAVMPRAFMALSEGMKYSAGYGRVAAIALVLLLPTTVLAGAVLPLLFGREGGGARVGRLLAANTVGAILGPLAAGFLLAPTLGLWRALAGLGLLMIAAGAGAGVAGSAAARGGRAFPASGATLLAFAIALACWPRGLAPVRLAAGDRLLAVREGRFGTVATVADRDGHRRIKLDNHYVLGGTASLADERSQGHLPLLLHPQPERVLFLGLGTGISAGASRLHPCRERVAVELVPEVVAAARGDFTDVNLLGGSGGAELEIVTDDARSFLAGSGRQFDVIVGDLFVPWRPGEAALYTEESFRLARQALAPGGLYCQWVPSWQIDRVGLEILLQTFALVFPQATAWRGDFAPGGPALALCGEGERYRFDPAAIDHSVERAAPRVAGSAPLLATPAGLWLHLLGRIPPGTDARRNSDARPWLELGARTALAAAQGAPAAAIEGLAWVGPELDARHGGWRDAGSTLGSAVLLAERGEREAANEVASGALRELPEETREALVRALAGPGS